MGDQRAYDMVSRPQRGGKINEMAEAIASRCGLPASTCADLLRHKWTYMEFIDKPSRWESPESRLTKSEPPKAAAFELSDEQWESAFDQGHWYIRG